MHYRPSVDMLLNEQFNKIGYEMYDKEQSRRVPAVRAKPGNPGYGFRRARWRNTMEQGEDRRFCESVLRSMDVSQERIDRIRRRIADFRDEWDLVRRPSRPAGPGRPRGHKRASESSEMGEATNEPAAASAPAASTPRKPKKASSKAKSVAAHEVVQAEAIWHTSNDATPPYGAASMAGGPTGVHSVTAEEHEWMHEGAEDLLVPPGHWDAGDEGHHTHTLIEENSSLRSLNMSLIYEREKLLRELREWDADMQQMECSVDGLLRSMVAQSGHAGDSELSEAFRWLSSTLVTKGRGMRRDPYQDLSPHMRLLLETCFDSYDEQHRSAEIYGEEGVNGRPRMHPRTHDILLSAATEDADSSQQFDHRGHSGLSPSEDLRVDLLRGGGALPASWDGPRGSPKRARARAADAHTGVTAQQRMQREKSLGVQKEAMHVEGNVHGQLLHTGGSVVADNHLGGGFDDFCDGHDMASEEVGNYEYLFSHFSGTAAL